MKRTLILLAALTVLFALPAWSQGQIDPRCTTSGMQGCVDWENGLAIAVGMGAPATWAQTPAQKNISAVRAARLDAARNLLELIKGLNLTSSSNVQGAMVANDQVQASIQGRLYGIRPVEPPRYFSDGSVQVKLEARLYEVIPQELYVEQAGGPPRQIPGPQGMPGQGGSSLRQGDVYSGLVVDASGLQVNPAMSPKIYDPQGREVYGSAYVDRQWATRHGIVGYVKSVDAARQTDRVQGNPAVVKAQEVKGPNSTDLVISQADADMLRSLAQQQTFLRESRVMIVVD